LDVKFEERKCEFKERKERCVMIRIGFDPLFEAELQHRELIKQVELYRLAQEGSGYAQAKSHHGSRILALLERGRALLGAKLDPTYGDNLDGQVNINMQDNSSGCTS
jgi:hypothetical protein